MEGNRKHPSLFRSPQLADVCLGSPGGGRADSPSSPPPLPANTLLSATEPAWLLGSSKVSVWEESSLARGPGLVTLAQLVACGHLSPRGEPGPGATSSSTFRASDPWEGLTQGMMLRVWGGMEKGFHGQHPSMGWAVAWP